MAFDSKIFMEMCKEVLNTGHNQDFTHAYDGWIYKNIAEDIKSKPFKRKEDVPTTNMTGFKVFDEFIIVDPAISIDEKELEALI